MLFDRFPDNLFRRNVFSQIQNIIAVVFQKNPDNILSNIMNIAFNSRQDDFSILLPWPGLIPPSSL